MSDYFLFFVSFKRLYFQVIAAVTLVFCSAAGVTYSSNASGPLSYNSTWEDGTIGNPTHANNSHTWNINHELSWEYSQEYYGTLQVNNDGVLRSGGNHCDFTINNLTLNGGEFQSFNNGEFNVTVNGTLHFKENSSSKNWRGSALFNGAGSITGSGNWIFSKNNINSHNNFEINGLDMTEYYGTLKVTNPGAKTASDAPSHFNFSLHHNQTESDENRFSLDLIADVTKDDSTFTWDLGGRSYHFESLKLDGVDIGVGTHNVMDWFTDDYGFIDDSGVDEGLNYVIINDLIIKDFDSSTQITVLSSVPEPAFSSWLVALLVGTFYVVSRRPLADSN
jgi:hypothetical protein